MCLEKNPNDTCNRHKKNLSNHFKRKVLGVKVYDKHLEKEIFDYNSLETLIIFTYPLPGLVACRECNVLVYVPNQDDGLRPLHWKEKGSNSQQLLYPDRVTNGGRREESL